MSFAWKGKQKSSRGWIICKVNKFVVVFCQFVFFFHPAPSLPFWGGETLL